MITRENLNEVIKQITPEEKKSIIESTDFEYVVLELSVFNTGSVTHVMLTNDCDRYYNVSDNGGCILEIGDVVTILEEIAA